MSKKCQKISKVITKNSKFLQKNIFKKISKNFKTNRFQEGNPNKEMQLLNSNKIRKNQNKLSENLGQEKKKICKKYIHNKV